jgi:hypothetical protein
MMSQITGPVPTPNRRRYHARICNVCPSAVVCIDKHLDTRAHCSAVQMSLSCPRTSLNATFHPRLPRIRTTDLAWLGSYTTPLLRNTRHPPFPLQASPPTGGAETRNPNARSTTFLANTSAAFSNRESTPLPQYIYPRQYCSRDMGQRLSAMVIANVSADWAGDVDASGVHDERWIGCFTHGRETWVLGCVRRT